MANDKKKSSWIKKASVTALSAVLLIGAGAAGYNYSPSQDIPTADDIANLVLAKQANVTANVTLPVVSPVTVYNDTVLVSKIEKLTNKVLIEDLKEEKAKDIVSSELVSKDFKKTLVKFLNTELNNSNSTSTVEDYKDIYSISVKDESYKVTGNDATVKLELKIGYFLDGDSDKEDLEYAKVNVTLSVSGLDEDEDYFDSNLEDYDKNDFSLIKFYD